jgi:hypothetical protein
MFRIVLTDSNYAHQELKSIHRLLASTMEFVEVSVDKQGMEFLPP